MYLGCAGVFRDFVSFGWGGKKKKNFIHEVKKVKVGADEHT